MKDVSELNMAALGFDYQVAQPHLVAALNDNAGQHGLYTIEQMQGILLDKPVTEYNPLTGRFSVTIGLQKSLDLTPGSFVPFPFVAEEIVVQGGKIRFEFDSPEPAAFFILAGEN